MYSHGKDGGLGKKNVLKVTYPTEIARCIWLLVGLVRSLQSSLKEALKKPLLCEDYSDLTSPTSNQIPDIHIAVSVVWHFLKRNVALNYIPC